MIQMTDDVQGPGFMRYFLVMLLVLIGAMFAYGMSLDTGSELAVVPNEIDLGTVRPGEALHAETQFLNNHSSTLRIHGVKSSCDCTMISEPRFSIPPGSSRTLYFEDDPPKQMSDFEGNLTVFYGDPIPTKTIKYRGKSTGIVNLSSSQTVLPVSHVTEFSMNMFSNSDHPGPSNLRSKWSMITSFVTVALLSITFEANAGMCGVPIVNGTAFVTCSDPTNYWFRQHCEHVVVDIDPVTHAVTYECWCRV